MARRGALREVAVVRVGIWEIGGGGMTQQDYNEQFAALENAFLRTRKDEQKAAMYGMICDFLRRMAVGFKRRHGLPVSGDNIDDIVQDGAIWFLSQYERKDFRVKKFTSYIVFAFRKSMFNEKRKQYEMNEIPLDENGLDYL